MAETPYETHNRLANEFVMMAGKQTETPEQLMVVVETTMLAALSLLVRVHGVEPAHALVYLEAALHAATERFAETGSAG